MVVIYKTKKSIRVSPNTSKVVVFKKNWLGKERWISASLLNIQSITPSSENHNSISNLPFATILHFCIVLLSRAFILAIENAHTSIGCGGTDRRTKISRTEICQHGQTLYRKWIQLLSFHVKISRTKKWKLGIFGRGGIYGNYPKGLYDHLCISKQF